MPVGTFGLLNAGLLGAIPAPRSSETASPVTAVAVECSARTSAERSRSGLRGATRVPNRPAERRLDVVGVAAAVVHVARLERHLAVAARYVEDVGCRQRPETRPRSWRISACPSATETRKWAV